MLLDNWPTETINVDSLADKINGSIITPDPKSFIMDNGGCCLACAIDNYFKKSQSYNLQTCPSFEVSRHPKPGASLDF